MPETDTVLRRLVEDRLAALDSERASLQQILGNIGRVRPAADAAAAPKVRRKRTLTPEARAAQGERMKEFWAARRVAKAAEANGHPVEQPALSI